MVTDPLTDEPITPVSVRPARVTFPPGWLQTNKAFLWALFALTIICWIPRFASPIDLRWDSSVYYILGTSLAEGKGYKLLNEPGEISAVQYPPLLPLIVAAHQMLLRTNDPTIVGYWLRATFFIVMLAYTYAGFRFCRLHLPSHWSFLVMVCALMSFNVYFISDLCFSEVLYSLATIIFLLYFHKDERRSTTMGTFLSAVAAYALRTVGLAILMAWVIDAVFKKKFKQAGFRFVIILIPIFFWQFYIHSVEKTTEYQHPAYSYQRAPYMFYNVTYSRNIALDNPFKPESGKAHVLGRLRYNAFKIPEKLGESFLGSTFWAEGLAKPSGRLNLSGPTLVGINKALINTVGIISLCGLLIMFYRKQYIVPIYMGIYLFAMGLTPFEDQFTRYLMPTMPFLIMSFFICILALINWKSGKRRMISTPAKTYILGSVVASALACQAATFLYIHKNDYLRIQYIDRRLKTMNYRVFFGENFSSFNLCVQYIREHAQPKDISAAGTPHWIYLQTGLKAVMAPFENNTALAQRQLDEVPVKFLVIGKDVIASERYTLPVVQQYANKWKRVFDTPSGDWIIYERVYPTADKVQIR